MLATKPKYQDPTESIRAALQFIPADDRERWVLIGMAIKSELGDEGFSLFDEWSQGDESYNERDARDVWRSFKQGGKVTVGTLYHEAMQRGYRHNGAKPQPPTPEQLAERQRIRQEDEARRERLKIEAREKALRIWKSAEPANADHPYLVRKGIKPTPTVREIDATEAARVLDYSPKSDGEPLTGRLLVAPVKVGEALSTLELIDEAGRKSAIYGGEKSGGYWAAQPMPESDEGLTLLIGEGVATVTTAREATGHHAIAALSCHNLGPVAKAMRAKYPTARLVILADIGKGQAKAEQAAQAVNGFLAVPTFNGEAGTDFNDLAKIERLERVRAIINAATKKEEHSGLVIRCLADVQPEEITWLWPGRIARGKVSMIAGDPGLGKSLVTLNMAARVSRGTPWPVDRSICPRGDVVLLSAEDDAADTIRPRLDAAGADVRRIHHIAAITDRDQSGKTVTRSFSLKRDLDRLGKALQRLPECALVIVDPISAYLDGTDSHNNADIRSLLAPLGELASEHRVAVVCVSHLNKGGGTSAMYRITGSLAFVAAARAALAVTKDPEDEARRLILPIKNNIGPDSTGLAYRVELGSNGAPFAEWEPDPVTQTAEEVFSSGQDNEERTERAEAKEWLRDLLRDGPIAAKEIERDAKGAGHQWRTLKRAKKELGIVASKTRFDGGWEWSLPKSATIEDQTPCPQTVAPFVGRGTLREFPEEKGGSEIVPTSQDAEGGHIAKAGTLGEWGAEI